MYHHYKKEHNIIVNGKLINLINKRFTDDLKKIDLSKQSLVFNEMFDINYGYDWIQWIFNRVIFEIYFLEHIPTIPVFYTKIFKIFQDGHVLIGWNGKFPPEYLCLQTPITYEDGNLIIF